MYIISVITTSPFYSGIHLFTHPLPSPYRQSMRSAFSEMIKVYLQTKGWVPTANWPISAIFILLLFLPSVDIINLVHTCLKTHNAKRGGRQFSMFMNGNICALVDLFDKAVAEEVRPNTVKTRSEPYDET